MSCSRGKASPNAHTKLRLFADSGGYCQNPECNTNLFLSVDEAEFHIAEMAHIFSASDKGPRAKVKLLKGHRGQYNNLILLCPTCHTIIDKVEEKFPDDLISGWKTNHSQRIMRLFNIKECETRKDVRVVLQPLLSENAKVFEVYGPETDERFNPESELPKIWMKKIHEFILPNNRKIIKVIDCNYELLEELEIETYHTFKQHVSDFEAKHINKEDINGLQFPTKMNIIFTENE